MSYLAGMLIAHEEPIEYLNDLQHVVVEWLRLVIEQVPSLVTVRLSRLLFHFSTNYQ